MRVPKPQWRVALACLALAGCASGSPIMERLTGGRVSGDKTQAIVRDMGSALEAAPLALAHCSRFKRKAQFAHKTASAHVFRCTD